MKLVKRSLRSHIPNFGVAAVLTLLMASAVSYAAPLTAAEATELGTEAYIYGYPLVTMRTSAFASRRSQLKSFTTRPLRDCAPRAPVVAQPHRQRVEDAALALEVAAMTLAERSVQRHVAECA